MFGAASLSPLTQGVQRHFPDPPYLNCIVLLLTTLARGYGLIIVPNDSTLKVTCEVVRNLTCYQSLWSPVVVVPLTFDPTVRPAFTLADSSSYLDRQLYPFPFTC